MTDKLDLDALGSAWEQIAALTAERDEAWHIVRNKQMDILELSNRIGNLTVERGALKASHDEAWAAVHVRDTTINETVREQREQIAALKAALDEIEASHDGNPPLALADMPELDYARRTIRNMRHRARAAIDALTANARSE